MSQLDTSVLGPSLVAGATNDHPESPNDAVPIELIDYMINYIHNDILTLRSCSLVCKAWALHLSRQHLFQWINLDHRNIAVFVSLLQSRSGSSPHTEAPPIKDEHRPTFAEPLSLRAEDVGVDIGVPSQNPQRPLHRKMWGTDSQ
jgi:hypothetical protein